MRLFASVHIRPTEEHGFRMGRRSPYSKHIDVRLRPAGLCFQSDTFPDASLSLRYWAGVIPISRRKAS